VKRRPTGRDPGKHCSSPSPPSTACVRLSICSSIARTSIRLQRCLYVYLQPVGARCTSYRFKQLLVSTGSTDSDVEYVNHLGARGHCLCLGGRTTSNANDPSDLHRNPPLHPMFVLNDCFVYLSEAQAVCVAEPPPSLLSSANLMKRAKHSNN
jgi:hypothetical protein